MEGSALGVTRDAWVLGSGGEQLGAESRVLIGRLAAALTPVPASGPVAALAACSPRWAWPTRKPRCPGLPCPPTRRSNCSSIRQAR